MCIPFFEVKTIFYDVLSKFLYVATIFVVVVAVFSVLQPKKQPTNCTSQLQNETIALHILTSLWIVCYKNYVHVFDWVCKILLISLIESSCRCHRVLAIYRIGKARRNSETKTSKTRRKENKWLRVPNKRSIECSRWQSICIACFQLSMLLIAAEYAKCDTLSLAQAWVRHAKMQKSIFKFTRCFSRNMRIASQLSGQL